MSSVFQGMSLSDHEEENDPDGQFAFRRKKNCHYQAVSQSCIMKLEYDKHAYTCPTKKDVYFSNSKLTAISHQT